MNSFHFRKGFAAPPWLGIDSARGRPLRLALPAGLRAPWGHRSPALCGLECMGRSHQKLRVQSVVWLKGLFFLQFSLKLISPNQETRNVVNTTPLLMTLCLIGMTIVIILGLTGIVTDPIEAKRVEHNIKSVSWHRPRPAKTLNMVLSCPSRVV